LNSIVEGAMDKTNVLVVDDLRSIRLTLGGILEDKGHNVVTVEDGYQAIEAVKREHFDVIFMDIKMPGINGVQTFREVKKIDPGAAVIMMTAYSVEDLVKEALEEEAYAIVYKPFDIDKIITIIEDLLHEKTLILVMDDQFGDRETLKTILEDKGYRVATARDGAEAIQMIQERHYDIIFLDVRLPGMDGVTAFEQVKEIDPRAAVIMMTGYSEEDLVKRAIRGGAYTCIYKPFDMEKVMALVDKIVKSKDE
jgi:two-component system response regulator HydG